MKRVIFGSFMFLTGMLSLAILFSMGTITMVLVQKLPVVIVYVIISVMGFLVSLTGLGEKEK